MSFSFAKIAIGASLSLLSATQLQACVAPRNVEESRKHWVQKTGGLKITGRYEDLRTQLVEPLGNGTYPPFNVNWHFGRVIGEDGAIFDTYHPIEAVKWMCDRPEGPDRSVSGDFYIQRNPEDGRYYIWDWQGEYLSREAGPND